MKLPKVILTLLVLCAGIFVVGTRTTIFGEEDVALDPEPIIDIVVSPKVVNLESYSQWVTVHTDIPYSQYDDTAEILLVPDSGDEVALSWVKVDNQGYLVAKFDIDDVKEELAPGDVTLEFIYLEEYGIDTITVIDGPSFTGVTPEEPELEE